VHLFLLGGLAGLDEVRNGDGRDYSRNGDRRKQDCAGGLPLAAVANGEGAFRGVDANGVGKCRLWGEQTLNQIRNGLVFFRINSNQLLLHFDHSVAEPLADESELIAAIGYSFRNVFEFLRGFQAGLFSAFDGEDFIDQGIGAGDGLRQ